MYMKRHFVMGLFTLIVLSAVSFSVADAQEPLYCPNYGEELVAVKASLPASEILAGANVPVTVRLENLSGLPLTSGSLLVRIVGESYENTSLARAVGNIYFREFVSRDIALKPSELASASFNVPIESNLPAGDYALDILFVPNEGYNIESPDLSIYEKSGANTDTVRFSVQNDVSNPIVYLDTKTLKTEESESTNLVSVDLVNTATSSVSVTVSWNEHAWNAVGDKTLKGTFVEKVDVPGSSKKTLSRSINISKHSEYGLVIEAQSNGIRSILPHGLNGSGTETLLVSAGVTKLSETGSLAAYGCVKNAFSDDETQRTVRVSVGRDVGVYRMSGATLQFLLDITKTQSSYELSVDVLSETGEVESTLIKTFSCELLGSCETSTGGMRDLELLMGITMLAAGLGGLFTLHHRKKKINSINQ